MDCTLPKKKTIILTKTHYTRSKTNEFINNYSFDEASKEWNKNKNKINNYASNLKKLFRICKNISKSE